jgi:hypothetical protein
MTLYFNDDIEQIRKIAAEQALAVITGEIKSRSERVLLYLKNLCF